MKPVTERGLVAGLSVVTIRDVARRAGVSVATASRALNGKQLVNSETRARILAVIGELGFTPSPMARRLSLGRTLTIGVVVSFLTRPQAAERLRGIEAVLAETEFDLVIYNVETVAKRNHNPRQTGHKRHKQQSPGSRDTRIDTGTGVAR
jgi:DNA-binding LacI/PurR family transcriptional regulator